MTLDLEFWFMLPVSVLIATTAMASGVEGATFFSPLFILALGLPSEVAIGTGLITEVFGFGSGLYAYASRRLIDYRLGGALLAVTLPAAILGTWVSGVVDSDILKTILGVELFAVALSFLRSPDEENIEVLDTRALESKSKAETCLTTSEEEEICYTVCNRTEGRLIAGVGGTFIGMVSTGLGELNGYFLLQRCRVPSKVAVATSVFVVAVTALVASTGHAVRFFRGDTSELGTIVNLLVFTIPGVVIGAQPGSAVARYIPQRALTIAMGILFILVALLLLGEVVLSR
ncbi:MAG: sulfite exporter TauE/SafE family protein [Actinomycetota bacterium]|nr:sulfite exporter TauE/SafE family protein [Actinomycetota bacterium]